MQVGTHFTEEVSLCRSLFETFFFCWYWPPPYWALGLFTL